MDDEMMARLEKARVSKMITSFQWEVFQHLMTIPAGKVTTYKQIAKAIKCNSSRAIGQALKKNPFAPDVPCHRVVRTDLTLGGFSGSIGNKTVERKMKILEGEGVTFQAQHSDQLSQTKVLHNCIWDRTMNEP